MYVGKLISSCIKHVWKIHCKIKTLSPTMVWIDIQLISGLLVTIKYLFVKLILIFLIYDRLHRMLIIIDHNQLMYSLVQLNGLHFFKKVRKVWVLPVHCTLRMQDNYGLQFVKTKEFIVQLFGWFFFFVSLSMFFFFSNFQIRNISRCLPMIKHNFSHSINLLFLFRIFDFYCFCLFVF